jgi:hypothetical protein
VVELGRVGGLEDRQGLDDVERFGALMNGAVVIRFVLVFLFSSGCWQGCYRDGDINEDAKVSPADVRSGCRPRCGWDDDEEKVTLGDVRVGKELINFYIVYKSDAAMIGFSVTTDGGPPRYFPMSFSTYRGVRTVDLEVFISKSEKEMWVGSSWPNHEILAYHEVGKPTALTDWGWKTYYREPFPQGGGGGRGREPFPELKVKDVVKVATFKHRE